MNSWKISLRASHGVFGCDLFGENILIEIIVGIINYIQFPVGCTYSFKHKIQRWFRKSPKLGPG